MLPYIEHAARIGEEEQRELSLISEGTNPIITKSSPHHEPKSDSSHTNTPAKKSVSIKVEHNKSTDSNESTHLDIPKVQVAPSSSSETLTGKNHPYTKPSRKIHN